MRHVRMLGLCVAAFVALCALTTAQAFAKETCTQYGEFCETNKEHANFDAFSTCPTENPAVTICFFGRSSYTAEKPSYFTAGKVTVALRKPITLLGGGQNAPEKNHFIWTAPVGAQVIEPIPQTTVPLTKGVNSALLSQSELERYIYTTDILKEKKTTATVELAGPASALVLGLGNLIIGEGTAFVFPVKVKLSNPFLGENCYVGSDEHPIDVPFTTGTSGELTGSPGIFSSVSESAITVITEDKLVGTEYEAPGVQGCGVNGGADEAIDSALGLPATSGNSAVINGTLKSATAKAVRAGLAGER